MVHKTIILIGGIDMGDKSPKKREKKKKTVKKVTAHPTIQTEIVSEKKHNK